VLLLRGTPTKHNWPNQYNGVGGHVESDEDIYTSAIREIREETGLEVQELTIRGVVNIPLADQATGILMFVFTAAAESRDVIPSTEGNLEWVPRDRLDSLDLVEDLPVILPLILDTPREAPPFFAHYSYDAQDCLKIEFAQLR